VATPASKQVSSMSQVLPSDEELKSSIHALLPKVDLSTTGVKQFTKLLSKEMGVDLKPKKAFIREALTEAINAMQSADEQEEGVDEEEEMSTPRPKKGKGGGGLAERKEISDKLAAFLGKGKKMARTDIVKSLWEYIREHDLQNPSNKREIFLDDAMREVFGCSSFTMFTMNKYIGAHIHPFKPVDLTPTPTKPRKRKASSAKGSSEKKKRKPGTQPPYRLSAELEEITGESILPRPQVVSKIWDYIKANNLQNPNDKREILCDDKLKAVMKGKNKVTMFNMNQFITHHLIEKVEKGSYQHEESEESE